MNRTITKNSNKNHNRSGLSIIEALISVIVVITAILGTASLRYQAVLDSKRAEVGMAASRLALMLVESWRGLQGTTAYNPVTELGAQLTIESDSGPTQPDGFTVLGSYAIVLNNASYYATLSYKDANASLRQLNVTVSWEQKGLTGASLDSSDKLFALTTYVYR